VPEQAARGLDWSWRFPWILKTALKIKQQQFVIDGEDERYMSIGLQI
jgi:ATP-dependent DNA ligase